MGEEWVTFCSPARFGLSCWWSNWRILLLRQSCREEQLWPELFCMVALRAGAAYLWHLAGSEVTCVVLWDGIHGFSALSMAQPSPSILSSLVELSWAWPCVEKMARGFSRRVQYCLVWQMGARTWAEVRPGQTELKTLLMTASWAPRRAEVDHCRYGRDVASENEQCWKGSSHLGDSHPFRRVK